MRKDKEKVLKCNGCDREVEECDGCGNNFEVSQKIICFADGDETYHFDSEECLDAFLNERKIDAITYLDDE